MTAEDLDTRRRAIKVRACRRGMREMDILLGGFVEARLASLAPDEIAALEQLLDVEDQKAFSWISGSAAPEPPHDTPLLRQIILFHSHNGPVNL
ncbi:MAG: succinate dehydrogenase assembly factor 2 [Rhodoblastus sp.]